MTSTHFVFAVLGRRFSGAFGAALTLFVFASLDVPPVYAQTAAAATPAQLARYDANKNGRLDPAEAARMRADEAAAQSSARPNAGEKLVTLTPFEVTSDRDVGYMAANTLAGSRLNTSLKDTAASLSVLTAEFLADIGANSLEEAMLWSTNSQPETQDTMTFANNTADDNSTFYNFTQFRLRGLPATTTRNYFAWRMPSDAYNIERVEEARGPNSILFGIGSAGGVVNTSTKRALFGRTIRSASVQAGSYEGYRGTIDLNQPVGTRLAVRLNAVYSHQPSYREYMKNDNRNVHLATTLKLLQKTRLRAEYETGIIDQVVGANDTVTDQFSNWTRLGNRMITTPIAANQNTAYGVARYAGGIQIYHIDNTGTLLNVANTYRSNGLDVFAGQIDPSLGHISVHTGGPGSTRRGDFETASIVLEQQIGRDTFVELSFNKQDNHTIIYQPAGNSRRLYADPNANLPNGQPNPFAGKYWLEGQTWTWEPGRNYETLRGTVAHDLDLGKWGKFRFAGLLEREDRRSPENSFVEVWEGAPFNAIPENAANQVVRRHYVTPGDWSTFYRSTPKQYRLVGLTDPTNPSRTLTSTMVPRAQNGTRDLVEEQTTKMIAAQARFLKERVVFGVGYRWDDLDVDNYGSRRNPQTQFWETNYAAPTSSQHYEGRTKTFGVVGHITKNLSAFYNKSDNFGLPGSMRILPDSLPPPNPESVGEDMGLALDLFGGKLFARASYYKVDLQNGGNFNYGGTLNNPSSISKIILDALVDQGVITETQAAPHRSNSTGSTFSRLSEGYELNLTANPTRNWRLQANFSFTDGKVHEVAPEVKAWVAEHMPFLQTPAFQNVVTNQGALTVSEVIAEFFEYHNDQLDSEGLMLPGNRKYKWNVFTSYNFSEGAFKGLMVGGGYSWQSEQPVGVVNRTQIRYSNDYWNTNAMIGYKFGKFARFPWVRNLRLQLNVFNVTDDREPQIYRYQTNDPANPLFNTVLRLRTKDPRTWRLTASFDF